MTGFVGKVKKPLSIVVIGAGMGGMTAAARLARVGHSVTILEASDHTGGNVVPNGLDDMHSIPAQRS